jgi:hypothetical protein
MTNAGVLLAMGFVEFDLERLWQALWAGEQRIIVLLGCWFLCSVGTALARDMAVFTVQSLF